MCVGLGRWRRIGRGFGRLVAVLVADGFGSGRVWVMGLVNSVNTLSTVSEELHYARNGNGMVPEGVTVFNDDGSITVFVGGPTVSTANGIPILAGSSFSIDMVSGERLYAVAASGTPVVRILVAHQ